MSTFSIVLGDLTIDGIRHGEDIGEICDRYSTPISFRCRGASCGTCAVRVLEGHANLSPMGENEQTLLDALFDGPSGVRLACQLQVQGPVTLVCYEESP
jgi:2Fe-2S ferredoxin